MNAQETAAPERGKQDKDLRQKALIEAAEAVFAEHGYDAATTRAVAERAGCSEGLIHRYFGGKRGLLMASLQARQETVIAEFRAFVPERDTVEEEIEAILLFQAKQFWEKRNFMRVAVSQATIDPEIGRAIGSGIDEGRVALVTDRLEGHRAAGRIRTGVDVHDLAHCLTGLGFSGGFVAQVVFGRDREQIRRQIQGMARLLAHGVAP